MRPEPGSRSLGIGRPAWAKVMPMPSLGSALDDFLYAPICQNSEGMTVSVLSAIARQDIDPWAEAARLAQLPKEMAVEQILGLLDTVPHCTAAGLNSREAAQRLSALLPRNPAVIGPEIRHATASPSLTPVPYSFNWRFFCIYLCLMLLMNWFLAEDHVPTVVAASPSPHGSGAAATTGENAKPNSGK